MGAENVTSLMQQTLMLVLWLSAPVLIAASVIGLLWALVQAVTQIQDQASAFVIKLVVVAAVTALTSGWMVDQLARFTEQMFNAAQNVKR
jgi:type III secretion HrpO family protein